MKWRFWLIMLLLFSPLLFAFSAPPPKTPAGQPGELMIDDFEGGVFKKNPDWWQFDKLSATEGSDPAKDNYALLLTGTARDWYLGGMGVYLANADRDFSRYTFLELDIYGYGKESGKLKIELFDDDNGNWQVEQDPKKGFQPIYDDRLTFEIPVEWEGWKHVSIPLSDFKDINERVGDDIWNPGKENGSGGMLQMQIVALASSKIGKVKMVIDNVAFAGKF